MANGLSRWAIMKPKCVGCIYMGGDVPCEYAFIKGITPLALGVKLDPEGKGGCALKEVGVRERKKNKLNAVIERKKPSKLDGPEFLEMYKSGSSDREIAERAGVARNTVTKWRQKNELAAVNPRGAKLEFDEKKVLKLYKAGLVDREISEKTGVPLKTIASWRKRRRLEANRHRRASSRV